jgi:uncharacterized protein (DUF342 family)
MEKQLSISVSDDQMSAYISGGIEKNLGAAQIESMIRSALSQSGITHGILDYAVAEAAMALSRNREVSPVLIAVGSEPAPAGLIEHAFSVPVYDRSTLGVAPDDDSAFLLYAQLVECVEKPHIVDAGAIVGGYAGKKEPQNGYTIYGDVLQPPDAVTESANLGRGLSREKDSSRIIATASGVIAQDGTSYFIAPINSNGAFAAEVTPDKLHAKLRLYPAGPGGRQPDTQAIFDSLAHMGIVPTVDKESIAGAVASLPIGAKGLEPVPIAEGRLPVNGRDGWVEYFVNLQFSTTPHIREDGRADYYHVHVFENVRKDQQVARIHPPERGIDGADVYGAAIKAEPGAPTRLKLGKNVCSDQNDPTMIISSADGHIYERNDRIDVEEVLRIASDIDYRTGNVHFLGDIEITGDVKAGFSVKAAGNLRIFGTVEDAEVESRQNIIVHAGFVGQGKGRISAGGDVVVSFVRNQTITAERSIMIAGEAIDSRLYAGDSIFVESQKSMIVGGEATARNLVRAVCIGNEFGNATRLHAGIDFVVSSKCRRLSREMEKLELEKQGVLRTVEKIGQSGLTNQRSLARARMMLSAEEIDRKIKRLEDKKKDLQKHLYSSAGRIEATQTAYAGTVLQIAHANMTLHESCRHGRFVLHSNQVIAQSL